MKVWLLDSQKFIKVNGLQPVTNAMMFDVGNVPTDDGLFSTTIFGVSTKDRRETFAYIDLKQKFLLPKAYITLKRLNRNFESVIYGTKKFIIDSNGVLVPDEEKGGTGMKWLYDNWEKIKFQRNDSNVRSERIDVIEKNKKDIIFTDKLVVIPAFYRDVNLQSSEQNPRVPEINDKYAAIIRNVNTLQQANNMDFVLLSITGKIQELIVDIYNILKDKIQGKSGYMRRFLMGKSVAYSSRVVITAAPYDKNSVEDQDIDFYHTGIPLSHTCAHFTPFIIYWVTRFFKNNLENQKNQWQIKDDKGDVHIVKLDSPETYFNSDYIEKRLEKFVQNPYTRFDKIELPIKDEELKKAGLPIKTYYWRFTGRQVKGDLTSEPLSEQGTPVNRELTWTDIFYQAAIEMTADKHVWVTRYPFLDYLGEYPSRITILSTRETVPMIVGETYYKKYPVVDLTATKADLDAIFRDTLNICALYLPGLGGDHDGDQVTVKPVFTQEANEECERIMLSKCNLLNIEGKGIRSIGNEGIQTLYSMTAFK